MDTYASPVMARVGTGCLARPSRAQLASHPRSKQLRICYGCCDGSRCSRPEHYSPGAKQARARCPVGRQGLRQRPRRPALPQPHYQIPYGWVDRTKEMQPGDGTGKGEVLLAVFERPPEAFGDSINSAVVIAWESAASYPGLKRAEDYLGPLTELATSKGFKAEGEPYALEVESRQLLRADFIKPLSDSLTMRQCTLVLLTKGQIVSFTFSAGSEDELDDRMDGLHFGAAKSSAH